MKYSAEAIRHALEWDGSSSIDDDGSDYPFEVLEEADPKMVASVRRQLVREEELMVSSIQGKGLSAAPRGRQRVEQSPFRDPWMNQF